jgi:hypothetical protein
MHHIELRIWTYIIWITNKIKPNLINLNWAIRVLHELNIRAKFKATQGNCWGKWPSEAFYHARPSCRFRLTHGFGYMGQVLQWWFNGNADAARVMWVLLCRNSPTERCWPSVPKARMIDFRRRRYGGTRSAARRVCLGSGVEAAWARCPERPDASRARSWAVSAPKVQCAAIRGCCKRVKGAPYEAETRGAACKGVSAVRRHAVDG